MITPETKIQVFISSACGDEPEKQKYNYVREALKVLIESTGFAKVYTFESEGASTATAGQHYISAMQDCDVCIFLIDNYDGVTSGTQTEIDTAKKHNIKSLFYFCDQVSKEETPVQKSLKGAQYAKSVTVHDFKKLIRRGATDLMNDLVQIYKHYCKGRLAWGEEQTVGQSSDISNIELSIHVNNVDQKNMITNIDLCVEYFTKLILEHSYDEVQKTENIDELFAAFLPVLFEGKTINEENFNPLLSELKKHQSSQHFAVVTKRYEAIREYFSGKQKSCICKLEEALQLAKQNASDDWLIKDILIDLRNQNISFDQSQNTFLFGQTFQQELEDSPSPVYYPLLDRLESDYYEGIIEETIKYKMQTPDTVTLVHNLEKHIRTLAGGFVLAMYNGSLSHIQLLYRRLKYMAFYCATRYSNWSIKKLLLKTTIIDGSGKEIDGVLRCFDDLRSKMNAADAYEVYSFANNSPIEHQQFIAKLEAFRVTAYYLDDESFERIWSELNTLILQWVEGENATVSVGGHIFSALKGAYLRIKQDELIKIVCKCLHNNNRRFYDDIFKLICNCINLDQASDESASCLIGMIINIVQSADERTQIHSIEQALYMMRKNFRLHTEELDKIISVEMPDFYNGNYRLETSDNKSVDMPEFLKSYIEKIRTDNETQGENGTFYGRFNQPHITIKNILQQRSVAFSDELIHSAFTASCETLLKEKQTIEAKMDAIELLVYLIESRPELRESNKQQIEELLMSKYQVESAKAIMSNLNETNLKFSALLLYHSLGEEITVELLNTLADIGDDALSNRKASKAFLNYLESSTAPVPNILLEHIILQRAIEWCSECDLDIRWNAVQILFLLLRNPANKNIICNQLVKRMDADNVYIKNKILRNAHQLKDIDSETLKYILEKAYVDTNYVVRKVVKEVQTKLE